MSDGQLYITEVRKHSWNPELWEPLQRIRPGLDEEAVTKKLLEYLEKHGARRWRRYRVVLYKRAPVAAGGRVFPLRT